MRGFFEMGKTAGEKHSVDIFQREEFRGTFGQPRYAAFIEDIICETAFDLVQAMSQTCGYEELESYYVTAFGLLMQGFAVGMDLEDLDIRECTETEDGEESEPFRELKGFDEFFRAGYDVW